MFDPSFILETFHGAVIVTHPMRLRILLSSARSDFGMHESSPKELSNSGLCPSDTSTGTIATDVRPTLLAHCIVDTGHPGYLLSDKTIIVEYDGGWIGIRKGWRGLVLTVRITPVDSIIGEG